MSRNRRNLETRILTFAEKVNTKETHELYNQLVDLASEVAKCNNEIERADINLEESIRELASARFTYEELLIGDDCVGDDLLMLELEIQANCFLFDRYRDDLKHLHQKYYILTKKFQVLTKGV